MDYQDTQTKIKDLKKGDTVKHYGHTFVIEHDAKVVNHTESQKIGAVYVAHGMCIEGEGNGYMAVGHPWTFQGTEAVSVCKLQPEVQAA